MIDKFRRLILGGAIGAVISLPAVASAHGGASGLVHGAAHSMMGPGHILIATVVSLSLICAAVLLILRGSSTTRVSAPQPVTRPLNK